MFLSVLTHCQKVFNLRSGRMNYMKSLEDQLELTYHFCELRSICFIIFLSYLQSLIVSAFLAKSIIAKERLILFAGFDDGTIAVQQYLLFEI